MLPICDQCQREITSDDTKSSKYKKKVIYISILGSILSITISILTYSALFGIALFLISTFFPYINYKCKFGGKQSLNLKNFLRIEIKKNGKMIKMKLLNKDYKEYLDKANLKNSTNITEKSDSSLQDIKNNERNINNGNLIVPDDQNKEISKSDQKISTSDIKYDKIIENSENVEYLKQDQTNRITSEDQNILDFKINHAENKMEKEYLSFIDDQNKKTVKEAQHIPSKVIEKDNEKKD